MSKQSLGEFLALLRKANGYTQQDVADKLNISNRTLSSWETDRTVPDILILPSIADLYGVTVDELLRGERNQPEKTENTEYSDKAKRDIRKNRFGKFSTKCSLLSGIAFTFEGILILAGILHLFAATPIWADILLTVIGAIGIAVCVVLIFYFANSVKLAEGVVLGEDLTQENKAFALAVRRKCGLAVGRLAPPILIFALLLSFFLLFNIVSDNFLIYYILIIVTNIVLGVIPLTFYIIYNCARFKSLANEKQIEKFGRNKKLLIKLCIFGIIPVIVFGVLAIALYKPINTSKIIYENSDFDDFKTYMETVIITEDDNLYTVSGAPLGEHQLYFPENADYFVKYDLGNNFTGELSVAPSDEYRNNWIIYYDYKDEDWNGVKVCTEYSFSDGNEEKIVVNARFDDYRRTEYDLTFGISIEKYCNVGIVDESYAFIAQKSTDLKPLALGLFIASLYASAIVCTVIYFVKRKRQDFTF